MGRNFGPLAQFPPRRRGQTQRTARRRAPRPAPRWARGKRGWARCWAEVGCTGLCWGCAGLGCANRALHFQTSRETRDPSPPPQLPTKTTLGKYPPARRAWNSSARHTHGVAGHHPRGCWRAGSGGGCTGGWQGRVLGGSNHAGDTGCSSSSPVLDRAQPTQPRGGHRVTGRPPRVRRSSATAASKSDGQAVTENCHACAILKPALTEGRK
eukprot:gene10445-biopygen22815